MHNFIRITTLAAVLIGAVAPLSAATPHEFYGGLLRRGVSSYEAGRYSDASKQLRIAAFGLVEAIDQYETAQVYLAVTYDKMQEPDRAREAARRVVVAERVERKYAALQLPGAVRTAFDAISARLLAPSDLAALRGTGPITAPTTTATLPQRSATSQPQTTTPPRRTTTTPQTTTPPAPKPAQPQQQPAKPAIATPTQRQTTNPENTAPQTITPAPQPEKPKPVIPAPTPAPAPVRPPQTTTPPVKPPQAATTTTTPTPARTTPPTQATTGRGGPIEPAKPVVTTPAPAPAPAAARTLTAGEIATRLSTAERALNGTNLSDARRAYRELLAAPNLERDALIRVAEGLYRSRDFASALTAFSRLGTLRRGEEPYRYYIAVALYETGDYTRAKKELASALPFIEITPDVARYRTRIEGSL